MVLLTTPKLEDSLGGATQLCCLWLNTYKINYGGITMSNPNRREFIQKSALVSGGLAVGGSTAPSQGAKPVRVSAKKRALLKLGLMSYNLARNWDIATIIKNCTEAKFMHVELRTTHAHKVEVNLSKQQRQEVRKRFEDSPLEAISLASGFSYHHADPAKLRQNIEGTKEYTKLAHDLGALGIRVFPNVLNVKGVSVEKTLEQIGRSLREVGEFAANLGVQIRCCNHGRGTNRIPVMRKIFDYANSPHVYLNWNCDGTDVEAPGFESNFNLVKDKIRNLHMHSLYNEKYPYRRLFQLLRENKFTGYCDAEIAESTEPVRLMKYYRALFLAFQDAL
jgi:sugar phosphate isomerase/epimerase